MEEKKNFIINVLFTGIIVGLAYLFLKYIAPAMMPFFIAFIFAYIAIVMARKLFKKDNNLFRVISLIIVYYVIFIIIILLASFGINKSIEFFSSLPKFYKNGIEPIIGSIENSIKSWSDTLPVQISQYLMTFVDDLFDTLKTIVLSISSTLVSVATSIVTGAPDLLISIMVVIIASFYFVLDYEKVINFIVKLMNEKTKKVADEIKDFVSNKLLKIIVSYIKIMSITFIELLIGLVIFGVDNAVIISLLTAVLDILPILGVGTVLIPWGIIDICIGKYVLGIEILVLYLVITVIRNILEPKLVGDDLGLHPLVTLIAMIVGLDLVGIIGVFGFPLVISFYINRKKEI